MNFGLTYKNFSTIGDIVFDNNFDGDKFQYTKSTGNTDVIVRSGHAHQFDITGNRVLYNGWTKVIELSTQYQIVSYDVGTELYSFEIGASVDTTRIKQSLQVFVNGKFKYPSVDVVPGNVIVVVPATAAAFNVDVPLVDPDNFK